MADLRLTDIGAFVGTLDLADILHVVDVSDFSQNPAGSSYKLTLQQVKDLISENIYNADGVLGGTRQVDLGTNFLKFINGTTFFIGQDDAFGTFNTVIQNLSLDDLFSVRNNGTVTIGNGAGGTFRYTNGSEGADKVLKSDATGNANWETLPVGIRNYIPVGVTVTVDVNYQYLIYGDLTIAGDFINNGQVVCINGGVVLDGGTFTNNGSLIQQDVQTLP